MVWHSIDSVHYHALNLSDVLFYILFIRKDMINLSEVSYILIVSTLQVSK